MLQPSVPLPAERFLICEIGIGENKLGRRAQVLGTGGSGGFWGKERSGWLLSWRASLYTILYTAVTKKIGRNVIPVGYRL